MLDLVQARPSMNVTCFYDNMCLKSQCSWHLPQTNAADFDRMLKAIDATSMHHITSEIAKTSSRKASAGMLLNASC